MTELAYVNGVWSPLKEAWVSVDDRGFLFGDAIYEVVAAYDGRPFLLGEHLHRLQRSATAIGLDLGRIPHPLEAAIFEGVRRCGMNHTLVYIQVTRGAGPRSHAIPDGMIPTVVMTFRPLPIVPQDLRRRGARVVTTIDTRWTNCYVKAVTLLPNVLAKTEAVRRGYDDAIFITESGEVRECTASNLFVVHGDSITIPPRTESILRGVTQGFLLDSAAAIGFDTKEGVCRVEKLLRASEVFMSGTTVEALGITSIDDRPVGDGRVGPVTQRMYEEFCSQVRIPVGGGPAAGTVSS